MTVKNINKKEIAGIYALNIKKKKRKGFLGKINNKRRKTKAVIFGSQDFKNIIYFQPKNQ